MNRLRKWAASLAAVTLALGLPPQSLLACAACFGKSDSQLAQGMNWGIFSLLLVVLCVLAAIAAFFIYLAKRAAAVSGNSVPAQLPELTNKN